MNRTLSGDVRYSGGELEISQCVWCRHRTVGGRTCRAYPDGIPEAIVGNEHDHRHPYHGDSGIRFEPEAVEIEFVGVEAEEDSVPLSTELAIAMARVGGASRNEVATEDSSEDVDNVITLEGLDFELDDDACDEGSAASS